MGSSFVERLKQAIHKNSPSNVQEIIEEMDEAGLDTFEILNSNSFSLFQSSLSQLNSEIFRKLLQNGITPNTAQNGENLSLIRLLLERLKECSCKNCEQNGLRCLNIFLEHGSEWSNEKAKNAESPILIASRLGLRKIALELIKFNPNFAQASQRQEIGLILEHLPELLLPILDESILCHDLSTRHLATFHLHLDLKVLLPKYYETKEPKEEMEFLGAMLKNDTEYVDFDKNTAIFQHPIVSVFTDLKWRKLSFLYYSYLAFHLNILFWYLIFLFVVIYVDCPVPIGTVESPFNSTFQYISSISIKNVFSIGSTCNVSISTKMLAIYLILCTFGSVCKETFHLLTDFWNYVFDVLNFAQMLGIIFMGGTAFLTLIPIGFFHFWLFPLASIGVGICWLQLFLHLGQHPNLALYVEMFSKIAINFIMSLGMYSFIIIGFVMSYCMVFPVTNPSGIDFLVSILRILTMMVGELNFEDLFGPEKWIRFRALAIVWYAVFLVMISMILMNLLVGLAVDDIGGCRKHSEIVVTKRKIRYLAYLEKTWYISTALIPNPFKRILRNFVSVCPKHTNIVREESSSNAKCSDFRTYEQNTNNLNKFDTVTIFPNQFCRRSFWTRDRRFFHGTKLNIFHWINGQSKKEEHDRITNMKHSSNCRFSNKEKIFGSNRKSQSDLIHQEIDGNESVSIIKQNKMLKKSLERIQNQLFELNLKVKEIKSNNI